MRFTTTPKNGASLYGPLIYEFGDEAAPRDLNIEITDAQTLETIARKCLYNTSSGAIDIAPLLRRRLSWSPGRAPLGFSSAHERAPRIEVKVEGVSVVRYFLPCAEPPTQPLLLSTQPQNRLLCRGEDVELLLDRDLLYVEVERFLPTGSIVEEYISELTDSPVLFRFTTQDMEPEVERLEVRLHSTTQEARIGYTLTNPIPAGVRVAWVGRGGSIEHYTFPILEQLSEEQERETLTMADASEQLLESRYRESWHLLSAYETPERARALVELGSAPALWICTAQGEYIPVEVLPREQKILCQGLLTALRFTLRKPLKTIKRWS